MDPTIVQTLLSWGALASAGFAIWRLFDRIRLSAVMMTNIKRDIVDLQKGQARQESRDHEIKDALKDISSVLADMSQRMTRIETQISYEHDHKG